MATSSGSSTSHGGGKSTRIKAVTKARRRGLNMTAYSQDALGTPF